VYHVSPQSLWGAGEAYTCLEEQVDEWLGRNLFHCKVPSEEKSDVQGKGNYPLRSVMTQLEHLIATPFECGLNDTNVVAFTKAAVIIEGHDAVEEISHATSRRSAKIVNLRWRDESHLFRRLWCLCRR
jgi:hypothetical protein